MRKGKTLRLNRFLQDPGCCAIGAVAAVANFYNKKINYDYVYGIVNPDGNGMYTPNIARLLNSLGFRSVTVISADINQLDFKWKDMERPALLKQLKRAAKEQVDRDYRKQA